MSPTRTPRTHAASAIEFPLLGPRGEPVDLRRTFASHGVATLPPMRLDEEAWTFEVTVAVRGARPRTAHVEAGRPGFGALSVLGPRPSPAIETRVLDAIRHVLNLDHDLSGFYEVAASDPTMSWVTSGAGRMIRSQSVFEEVVKTIATTNCSWSLTTKMVGALVEHLGDRAPGAPATGAEGRTFPSPAAMAEQDEGFYRDVVKAGYRSGYLRTLARMVVDGEVDLEELGRTDHDELPDAEVATRLQALPGVGPYAAAHVMMMLGRYSALILDSWTRPKYARLVGKKAVADSTIVRRFRPYGRYAGLAFWMFLTRDWVEEQAPPGAPPVVG